MDDRLDYNQIDKSIMRENLIKNFELLLSKFSKVSFVYPTIEDGNIRNFGGPVYYYQGNQSLPVNTSPLNIQISASRWQDYKITFKGNAKPINDAVKSALGFRQATHAIVFMLEIPTRDTKNIFLDNRNIVDGEMVLSGVRQYMAIVIGVYKDVGGTTRGENIRFTVKCNGFENTYETDVSNIIIT